MKEPVTVIVVEDDQILRESLRDYLILTGFEVEVVGTGVDFYESLKMRNFAVAVIDIGLPDQSGYNLVEYARMNTSMGLIIITANDSIDARITGYHSGCDLFFCKPVHCRELAAAIINIALRQMTNPKTAPLPDADIPVWILERSQRILVTPTGVRIPLTGKEFHVLDLLACMPGEAVGREKLLQRLYIHSSDSNNRAFDTLLYRLRKKIEQHIGSDSPIMTAYCEGYYFSAPVQIH